MTNPPAELPDEKTTPLIGIKWNGSVLILRLVGPNIGQRESPIITEEFSLANFQLQMGRPRREVLHDLGVRSGVDDLKALSAILIQADRLGITTTVRILRPPFARLQWDLISSLVLQVLTLNPALTIC